MQHAREYLRHLGKVLHTQTDDITHEPLPQRWVDLIRYLDEKERMRSEDRQREAGPPRGMRPARKT
jgi:hypothetical protein